MKTERGRLVLYVQGKGHYEKDTPVIIHQGAKNALYDWLAARGKKSHSVIRAYLRLRIDNGIAMWVAQSGERLINWGFRLIVRRGAVKAGEIVSSLHAFRRAFALNMLRTGVDIFSLQKLMGHADLQVLRKYLAQTTEDIASVLENG